LYVPGDLSFHPDASGAVPRNHLRLNFVQVTLEQIEPGIARLAEVIKQAMPLKPSSVDRGSAQGVPGVVA
jgi:DNA-binding transcriptional MocR family regulator